MLPTSSLLRLKTLEIFPDASCLWRLDQDKPSPQRQSPEKRAVCGIRPCQSPDKRVVCGIRPCQSPEKRAASDIRPCQSPDKRAVFDIQPWQYLNKRAIYGIRPCQSPDKSATHQRRRSTKIPWPLQSRSFDNVPAPPQWCRWSERDLRWQRRRWRHLWRRWIKEAEEIEQLLLAADKWHD